LGTSVLVIAGWAAASLLTALVLLPLLRVASRAAEPPPGVSAPVTGGAALSVLRDSGYLGIVLERLVLHACTIFDADQVCVFGRDSRAEGDGLVLVQGAGVNPDLIGRRLGADLDPILVAVACGRPLAIPGELWPVWRGEDAGREAPSGAAVAPIWFGGRLQGAVGVVHSRGWDALGVSGLALLGTLAELAGQVLAHTEGRQLSAADPQLEIDGLLGTLARAEPEAGPHADRVAALARGLADDLCLGGPDRLELGLAARLHDAGKLRVPAHVLRRTPGLSGPERELLCLQPLWGAEMVARIPGLEAVALIVRLSHERWDGRGYPDGLAGEQIPLASRIIALAGAFSSMTAARPYGRALDPGAALYELQAHAGTRFDPDLTSRLAGVVSGVDVPNPA
jgi:hypothetical protein